MSSKWPTKQMTLQQFDAVNDKKKTTEDVDGSVLMFTMNHIQNLYACHASLSASLPTNLNFILALI